MSTPLHLGPEALLAESAALRAVARALLENEHDAEDVVQDTALATLERSPTGIRRLAPWLRSVVRNFVLRIRRKDEARQRWERAAARPESLPSTVEMVEQIELHRQVVDAVLALDEPYRSTIFLRFWENLPPRLVAQRMGVPVGTVRTRVRRALALLRNSLDRGSGGRGAWGGLLASWLGRAPRGGTAAAPATGFVLTGIMLMTTKLKIAAATIGVAALVCWSWGQMPRGGEIGPGEHASAAAASLEAKVDLQEPADEEGEREQVRPGVAGAEAGNETDQAPVLVEPYQITIHVVDAKGFAVPQALVAIWGAEKADVQPPRPARPSAHSGSGYTTERQGLQPFLQRMTDQTGRCTVELDREFAWVHASKEGFGESDDQQCHHRLAERDGELVLALHQAVRLRGRVLRAGGLPAANVNVRFQPRVTVSVVRPSVVRPPQPAKTDFDGRFETLLRPRSLYEVLAQQGELRAVEEVRTASAGDKEVVLRFPGALSIRGFLVGADGRPVANGQIKVWETVDPENRDLAFDQLRTLARTAADGSFRIDVKRHGAYRIVGHAKAHANSELSRIEVTEVRPHTDVVVRLLEPAAVAGIVRREGGDPVRGAVMFLHSEKGESHPYADRPNREDLYGCAEPVKTGADGSFRFSAIHPETTYTLTCCPDPKHIGIKIKRKGIAPGREGLVMVLSEASIRGSSLTGRVVEDVTGKPVSDVQMKFVHYGTAWGLTDAAAEIIEPGRYLITGLSLGATYTIAIIPKEYAPTVVGPITTTGGRHVLDVRVKRFGEIACRVVDEHGEPLVGAHVMVRPLAPVPGTGGRLPVPTDSQGMLHVREACPGKHEAYVCRDRQVLGRKEVEVMPGKATEVELRIPR